MSEGSELRFMYGPMNSGKSADVLKRAYETMCSDCFLTAERDKYERRVADITRFTS